MRCIPKLLLPLVVSLFSCQSSPDSDLAASLTNSPNLFLALAQTDTNGGTQLLATALVPLKSAQFCLGVSDCSNTAGVVVAANAQTLANGKTVFASAQSVVINDGQDLTVSAQPADGSAALRLHVRFVGVSQAAPGNLDPQALLALAQQQPAAGVDGVLAALPEAYRSNLSLVYDSKSIQSATGTLPRQVLFGWDARFILAAAAVPNAAHSDELEFASYNQATGHYEYGTLTFGGAGPQLNFDATACEGCHGRPARPIWGSYPDWPGVYGDHILGSILPERSQDFATFLAQMPSNPRYRSLKIDTNGPYFRLMNSRAYNPNPNTVFENALLNTVATGAYTRIQASPNYASLKWLPLFYEGPLNCGYVTGQAVDQQVAQLYSQALASDSQFRLRYGDAKVTPLVMAYRLLGVDPVSELNLAVLSSASSATSLPDGMWFGGAVYLQDEISLANLVDLAASDSSIQQAFGSTLASAQQALTKLQLAGDARGQALQAEKEYPAWYTFRDNVFSAMGSQSSQLCSYLQSKLQGATLVLPAGGGAATSPASPVGGSTAPAAASPSPVTTTTDGGTAATVPSGGSQTFHIPAGTGSGAWNTQATLIQAHIGDTVHIINDDSIVHILHTNGAPCGHGTEMQPGGSYDCVITQSFDPNQSGPLYDHNYGPTAAFWLSAS